MKTIKNYVIAALCGALIIIALNSTGNVFTAGIRSNEKGYTTTEREIISNMAACMERKK